MIKYKLTTQALTTYDGFQWEVGKKVTASSKGELCGPGWLHYYHHPLLAVLLNPVYANIVNPKLFKVEAGGEHKDDLGRKGGCTEMTLLEEIPLPDISDVKKRAFAILCAKEVYSDNGVWDTWAEKWLNGERGEASRIKAREAAYADYVAYATVGVAYVAGDYAAYAGVAAAAAYTDADAAAYAGVTAAYAAAYAAGVAYAAGRKSKKDFNLAALAEKALTYR